jgi:hypothetical protein
VVLRISCQIARSKVGETEVDKMKKMLDNLIVLHGMRSTEDMFRCMANRGLWGEIIAYAVSYDIINE